MIFAGDAAHQVSPFGARGANSGLEDAENLGWKLDRVLRGTSPEALLESYHTERSAAADENIRESTRSTDFMAPNSHQEARLRKAVLSLAKETEFGKRMVNGGRLSVPSIYDTPLSTADGDTWRGGPRPGASMPDAPVAGPGGEADVPDRSLHQGAERGSRCWSSAMVRRSDVPEGVGAIRIGGRTALPIPQALPPRATMPNPAPPICCGPTAMSPRVSGIRPAPRSTRRWRAPPATTEVSSWRYRPRSNFAKPDDAFRAIVEAHRGLSDEQSADLDAALVLVLANHIGDIDVLREAIALAKRRMLDASQQQQQQQ